MLLFVFHHVSTPTHRDHILGLAALGVQLVVTLTEEEPLPVAWFEGTPVRSGRLGWVGPHAPDLYFPSRLLCQVETSCGWGASNACSAHGLCTSTPS
jgi:hypothetical protein